jgi:hypothetical protein
MFWSVISILNFSSCTKIDLEVWSISKTTFDYESISGFYIEELQKLFTVCKTLSRPVILNWELFTNYAVENKTG